MTTSTKLNLASFTSSTIMLANVFSRPLGIPEGLHWFFLIGVTIPLGLVFVYASRLKAERTAQVSSGNLSATKVAEDQKRAKKTLVILWICMVPFTMSFPFWMPTVTGLSLGFSGNIFVSLATLGMVSGIFWFRLRKMPNQSSKPSLAEGRSG